MSDLALALDQISKRFGSVDALRGASLAVRSGTVHALLGENGAGKSTLMRIAYGLVQPDAGAVRIDGRLMQVRDPAMAIRSGVGMVHQHFTIVHAMTVAENAALGGHGWFDQRTVVERIRSIGKTTGFELDPDARAGSLGVGSQQQLEIVKALAQDARTLILDEPTAVLAPGDAELLLRQLRRLADGGLSVVLITHKLREALLISDDVTVLRQGATVLTAAAARTSEEELADAMLGVDWRLAESPEISTGLPHAGSRALHADRTAPRASSTAARSTVSLTTALPTKRDAEAVVVRAVNVSIVDEQGSERVRGATFALVAGEIVGVAGIEGSGAHELLRAVAGRMSTHTGTLDRPASVGFVPEDRHRNALVLDFTLTENIALKAAGRRSGLMPWASIRARTRALIDAFDIRVSSSEQTARSLSGGNQQKLVLARELADRPPALVIENPTRGLDLRASAAVHARLRSVRDQGTAIMLYSSDIDELLALSDRMLVVYAGTVIEVPSERAAIGLAMLGTSSSARSSNL
jgi:simple sugar transport system ATP-binding protein